MFKKIAILISLLLAIFALGIGYVIYRANDLVAKYTPLLEQEASTALKTPVKLGQITISLWPKTSLSINQVALGAEQSLKLGRADIAIDPLSLLSGKLSVTELEFLNPVLTIVKDGSGIRIEGLAKAERPRNSETTIEKEDRPKEPTADSPLQVDFSKIVVSDGSVKIKDLTTDQSVEIKELNLGAPLKIVGESAVISDARVAFRIDETPVTVRLAEGKVAVSGKDIDWKNLILSLPAGTIESSGKIVEKGIIGSIKSSSIDISKVQSLAAKFSKQLTELKLTGSLSFDAALEGQSLVFKSFDTKAFSGSISSPLVIGFAEPLSYSGPISIQHLQISEILEALKSPSKLTGEIEKIALKLSGTLSKDPVKSLETAGTATLKNLTIPGVNVIGEVIRDLQSVPALGELLMTKIPQRYLPVIKADSTSLSTLEAQYSLNRGTVNLSKFSAENELFRLQGSGTVVIGGALNINSTIYLSPELSSIVAGFVKEAGSVLDQEGRLSFALVITGTPTSIIVKPNTEALIKQITKAAISSGAKKVLENFIERRLGGDGGGALRGLLGF